MNPHQQKDIQQPPSGLSTNERKELESYGCDVELFENLRAQVSSSAQAIQQAQYIETLEPPPKAFVQTLDDQKDSVTLRQEGQKLIAQGHLGLVVLNGGMATRFGQQVKGIVELTPGQSFLAKIITQTPAQVPIFVMNSLATHQKTLEHFDANHCWGRRLGSLSSDKINNLPNSPNDNPTLIPLLQSAAPRINLDGSWRRIGDRLELYAPGHGDLIDCLSNSTHFQRCRSQGLKWLMIVNIDNLGATLCPELAAMHARSNAAITVEVVPRPPQDQGGILAWHEGRVQIIEGFRIPPSFHLKPFSHFNTNTLWLDADLFAPSAQDRPSLTWYAVQKQVHGAAVIQYERLIGEMTRFFETQYIEVTRTSRFTPIKTLQDLADYRARHG